MSERLFRKRADGPWYGWLYTLEGERIRFSTGQIDKNAAKQVLRQREREATSPTRRAANEATHTVEDALRYLVEHAQSSDWAEGTRHMHLIKSGHVLRILGTTRIAKLTKPLGLKFIDQRLAEGAARSTVAKELQTLRAALKQAVLLGWWHGDPRSVVPSFATKDTPRTRYLTPDEFTALSLALPPARRLWLTVACYTGGRLSEVERLDWADVDLAKGWIQIRGTKTRASHRAVPIASALAAALARVPVAARRGPVVGHWTKVWRDLSEACARAGIAHVSPNDLRRSFASWLKQAGVDSKAVADLLGHMSTTMVDRVYGKLSSHTLVAAVAHLPENTSNAQQCSQIASLRGDSGDKYGTNPGANGAPMARMADVLVLPTARKLVPETGFEPVMPYGRGLLRPLPVPFGYSGGGAGRESAKWRS